MNNAFCFVVIARRYELLVLAGFKDLHCVYTGMNSNIFHSNECIIRILILCDISTLIVPHIHPVFLYPIFFAKGSYFHLNAEPANPSLALHHKLTDLPPTCINSSRQHLISLHAWPASKQELLSSWKKRGAMAVTSGSLGLNNTWRTTIIVGQWCWNMPASRESLSNAATATMAWTP
jgi:hypothetical protein